jgi:hypothetical protein
MLYRGTADDWLLKGQELLLERAALKMKPGQRSGRLDLGDQEHCVVELVAHRTEGPPPLAEVRGTIEARLQADATRQVRRDFIAELRRPAKIWMAPPDVLRRVLLEASPGPEHDGR